MNNNEFHAVCFAFILCGLAVVGAYVAGLRTGLSYAEESQQIAEQCLYQVEHVIEVGNDLLEQCQ